MNSGPYRAPPPAPKRPPRAPWHRLLWALARGVFVRLQVRQEKRRLLALIRASGAMAAPWSKTGIAAHELVDRIRRIHNR